MIVSPLDPGSHVAQGVGVQCQTARQSEGVEGVVVACLGNSDSEAVAKSWQVDLSLLVGPFQSSLKGVAVGLGLLERPTFLPGAGTAALGEDLPLALDRAVLQQARLRLDKQQAATGVEQEVVRLTVGVRRVALCAWDVPSHAVQDGVFVGETHSEELKEGRLRAAAYVRRVQ